MMKLAMELHHKNLKVMEFTMELHYGSSKDIEASIRARP